MSEVLNFIRLFINEPQILNTSLWLFFFFFLFEDGDDEFAFVAIPWLFST